MSWNQYSETKLIKLEKRILSLLKSEYKAWYVPIIFENKSNEKIWTVSLNTENVNTPLVLLHGFGAGVGFWCLNLDALSQNRPVYAMDLLGFGRSSRPSFNKNGLDAEKQIISSIEEWRKQLNLKEFILLGHSMGGYLATSYAITFPERVKHLILADPWGFPERDPNTTLSFKLKIVTMLVENLNPLATVRAFGPFGPWLVQKFRNDIICKYESYFDDKSIIPNYIYHCNAQNPTGEIAFHNMLEGLGYAKYPMIKRVHQLDKKVPITFLYGSETWMDKSTGLKIKDLRQNSIVNYETIFGAGHHVHADQPALFNEIVDKACAS